MGIRVAIITVSDKCSCGERKDESGEVLKREVALENYEVALYKIIPDEREELISALKSIADDEVADLILTTGGTGLSRRDVTPEATKSVIEKDVPGIPEMIRTESAKITKRTYLSRGVAGIRKNTLIVNLPGSPKAAKESFKIISSILDHGLEILSGRENECGTDTTLLGRSCQSGGS